jgi:murein DD-endopeptidase MepM/ murein hydrolase activator NlpD
MGLIVPGIFGTLALPAFAVPGEEAPTQVNAMLSGDVQSFTVSSAVLRSDVVRDGYSATTAEELAAAAAAKAAAAAQAAAAQAAAQAKASGSGLRNSENDSSDVFTEAPGGWQRPVSGPISSPYGPRRVICNGGGCSNGFHDGVDFSEPCGTPVRAVSAGRVTFVGSAGAYGQRVIVDHGGGVESIYGHLQSGSFRVSEGELVDGGTTVAAVGATGVVSGCHLDLKIRINGSFTNPTPFLRARGVSM